MTERLARSAEHLRPSYDAVVIGSGYGGGVAASRLARMGLTVAVLERGREWLPGDFPVDLLAAQRETRISGHLFGRDWSFGQADALVDVHLGSDVHVVVGSGLGGTSLINANVCLSPDTAVLADPGWPTAIRQDRTFMLGFARARTMLRPLPLDEDQRPAKFGALEISAKAAGTGAQRVPLHIAFKKGLNAAGEIQAACVGCGDCMAGCNVGAKTTVRNTYLFDAARHGAELFTRATVRSLEQIPGGGWRVRLIDGERTRRRTVPTRSVTAPIVILAAGTLGSNEILMRSAEHGLELSERLGAGFSCNGDAVAFAWNTAHRVNAVGVGHPPKVSGAAPGPAVTGLYEQRVGSGGDRRRVVVVEAAVQSAVAPLIGVASRLGSVFGKEAWSAGIDDAVAAFGRSAKSVTASAYKGPTHQTQVFLAIARDTASGRVELVGDRVAVNWPNAGKETCYADIREVLHGASEALGGQLIMNPISARWLGGEPMTVHPLGGIAMGEDRSTGVVDHKGRVFDARAGKGANAVHTGLYVCDGSIVPMSLGVHPLLTITALAERAMLHLARDHGLTLDLGDRASQSASADRAPATAAAEATMPTQPVPQTSPQASPKASPAPTIAPDRKPPSQAASFDPPIT